MSKRKTELQIRTETLRSAPAEVKIRIKNCGPKGIPGLPFVTTDSRGESARQASIQHAANVLGMDLQKTGGTGFVQIKNASCIRIPSLLAEFEVRKYQFCFGSNETVYNYQGKPTVMANLTFAFSAKTPQKLPAETLEWLNGSYFNHFDLWANPSFDDRRVDSIVCVKAETPVDTSVETGQPGQMLMFDGLAYTVTNLMPEERRNERRRSRKNRAKGTNPSTETYTAIVTSQGPTGFGATLGDLLKGKIAVTAPTSSPAAMNEAFTAFVEADDEAMENANEEY